MSAIATFTLLPISALDELREAASSANNPPGDGEDSFFDFLATRGREVADYGWSGYVAGTALDFLEERGIDLMRSDYDELAHHICEQRGTSCLILTAAHRHAFLPQLAPESFSQDELRDYYNEFNETSEPEAGEPMLDAIRAIHESLSQVNDSSVVLVQIG